MKIKKDNPNILGYIIILFICNLCIIKLEFYGLVVDLAYFIFCMQLIKKIYFQRNNIYYKKRFLIIYPFIIFLNTLFIGSFTDIFLIILGIILIFFYIKFLYNNLKKFFLYIALIIYTMFILLFLSLSLEINNNSIYQDKSYACIKNHVIIKGRILSAGAMDGYHFEVTKTLEIINIKYLLKIELEKYYSNKQESYEKYDCRSW